MSQPEECPIATSERAARAAPASSAATSAPAISCSGAKLRPAARSAKSAALTAWLRCRISFDSFRPTLVQRRSSARASLLPKIAPPTRSSPEGVRPAPSPSSGSAAASTAAGSSSSNARPRVRTSGVARSSGNCGVSRTSSAPKPPAAPRRAACLFSLRAPATRFASWLRSGFSSFGDHAVRGTDSNRNACPRSGGVAVNIARGCRAGSRAPIQTISRPAWYHGEFANASRGSAAPPLRSSARRARSPIATILSSAPASAAGRRRGRPRRTARIRGRRQARPSSRASRRGSARSRRAPRR